MGNEAYKRSVLLLMLNAIHKLDTDNKIKRVTVEFSLSKGLYCDIKGDFEITEEMNQGFVKGLSTQRPYDQGKAAALAVAKSLVSDNVPKYIGVQPYVVHEKQLKRAWKDIFFEALPEELG